MTLAKLQRLCLKGHPRVSRPFVRRRGREIWTCASDAHALIAVRGALTNNEDGLGHPSYARKVFRREVGAIQGWLPPTRVQWSELSRFLRTKRPGVLPSERYTEGVEVFGVRLRSQLARKFIRGLKAKTVLVRVSPEFINVDNRVKKVRTPDMIRIDAPDWSLLIMAALLEDRHVWARFPEASP